MSRCFHLVVFLLALRCASASAADAATRVAVFSTGNDKSASIADLVAAEIARSPEVQLVERDQIRAILKEQQFGALLAPDGASERNRFGHLLNADLIVVLREQREKDQIDFVVAETDSGYRLLHESASFTNKADQTVSIVAGQIRQAMKKHREKITQVCAVPSFLSQDLGFQFDYLKSAYAALLEQELLQRPGTLVVELEEAESIGRELAIGGGALRRPLPLYLLGEFRNDTVNNQRKLRLKLTLRRGEQTVNTVEQSNLAPDSAPDFLRESLGKLLTESANATAASDPKPEVEQLKSRAADFSRLGQWHDADDLLEAALLLMPNDADLHKRALIIGRELIRQDPPGMGERTRTHVERATAIYVRTLEHAEAFLKSLGPAGNIGIDGRIDCVWDIAGAYSWNASGNPSEIPDDWRTALKEGKEKEREFLFRFARIRAQMGYEDDDIFMARAIDDYPESRQWELLAQMLEELQDLPGAGKRTYNYATHGVQANVVNTPAGREFLDKLATYKNPQVRLTAEWMKKQLPQFARQDQALQKYFGEMNRPATIPSGGAGLASSTAPAGMNCLALPDGTDLFWNAPTLQFVTSKNKPPTTVFRAEMNDHLTNICFDGKYIWAPIRRFKHDDSLLLVIDPSTRQIWRITEKDGLPRNDWSVQLNTGTNSQTVVATALSPGKVMIAGTFGQTWIATVDFDPSRGATVRVFHEAREAPDREDKEQWRNTKVIFDPLFMFLVTERSSASGAPRRRVILGRGCSNLDVMQRPLLIDPETLAIEPMEKTVPWIPEQFVARGDAIYFVQRNSVGTGGMDNAKAQIYRVGFPDFHPQLVNDAAARGPHQDYGLAFMPQRVLLLGESVWQAQSVEKPFTRIDGSTLPIRRSERPVWQHSNIYGDYITIGGHGYELP